jgi:hypothetical protein
MLRAVPEMTPSVGPTGHSVPGCCCNSDGDGFCDGVRRCAPKRNYLAGEIVVDCIDGVVKMIVPGGVPYKMDAIGYSCSQGMPSRDFHRR